MWVLILRPEKLLFLEMSFFMKIFSPTKKRKTLIWVFKSKTIFEFLFDEPIQQSNTSNNVEKDEILNAINDNTRKSTRI